MDKKDHCQLCTFYMIYTIWDLVREFIPPEKRHKIICDIKNCTNRVVLIQSTNFCKDMNAFEAFRSLDDPASETNSDSE